MDKDQFWRIVDATAEAAGDDVVVQSELLKAQLTQLSIEEILSFDTHFTQASHGLYSWATWRAADIMIGDTSDDVFADFRSWVISRGREAYERVLTSPDAGLAALDLDDQENIGDSEVFGAAAGEVYRAKTGRDLWDDFPERPSADFPAQDPDGPEITGSRKERRQLFPQLAAKYSPRSKLRFPWRN